ncbi:hypothetical protein [Francisella philomiragia]|uniref:hypothetical protein n=1 Tax=Francisella philomiragia TaxID=28110 RepID=UPI0019032DF7|nr:hypothetical protein [Francisella philomiragia]MBK2297301.1 hypothetical protein [Francisella philomiragia]
MWKTAIDEQLDKQIDNEIKTADLIEQLTNDLDWYANSNIESLQNNFHVLKNKTNQLSLNLEEKTAHKNSLEASIVDVSKNIKSMFNPKNWFNAEQKSYKRQRSEFNAQLATAMASIAELDDKLKNTKIEYKQAEANVIKYKNFDIKATQSSLDHNKTKLEKIAVSIDDLKKRKAHVNRLIQPKLKILEENTILLNNHKIRLNDAQKYQRRLDNATTGKDRAIAHNDCERALGYSNPKKIINDETRNINRLQRDIDKIKTKLDDISAKLARPIKKLIIDGNNLCYEKGRDKSNFIGLKALIPLTKELSKSYGVTVIFDSQIRKILKAGDKEIAQQFDKSIKVHPVASKQLADETIVRTASDDKTTYIISNDRYADYADLAAVKMNKLIKHEIINNKVIINDLLLEVDY